MSFLSSLLLVSLSDNAIGCLFFVLTFPFSSSSRRGYAYQRVQDTEMEEFPPNHEHHGRHSNDTPIELVETKVGSSNQHASLEERTRSPEETSESSETLLEKDEDDLENGAPEEESFGQNPFKPLPDLPAERPRVLTARALIVGLCAGALVNASNVYLGLKSGWTFSANLFGVSPNPPPHPIISKALFRRSSASL